MEHKYKSLLDLVLSFLSSPSSVLEHLIPLPIRCAMLQNTDLLGVPTHSIPVSNPCLCSYLTCWRCSFPPIDLAVSLHFLSLILGILFLKEPFLTTFLLSQSRNATSQCFQNLLCMTLLSPVNILYYNY